MQASAGLAPAANRFNERCYDLAGSKALLRHLLRACGDRKVFVCLRSCEADFIIPTIQDDIPIEPAQTIDIRAEALV